ncbi:PUA-like domain-containing protein [Jimgerdemannia flammicorona]|uniref:PUA-like domain-containing protein n=1 Tax=Jimgerdemannia flammicorona TaxID=994334 RepID=A0A433QEH7_9FUNG|nr:PUA-like domain-containing protein [Jimgerdemannia flammicorona]
MPGSKRDGDEYEAPKKKSSKGPRATNTYAGETVFEEGWKLRSKRSVATRRSSRLAVNKADESLVELPQDFADDEEDEDGSVIKKKWTGGHVFGHIPGIEIGHCVALSGGYEDDVDLGEAFTYTGSGGRDLKGTKMNPKNLRTAPQSADQKLEGGNLALKVSYETKKPVRVIRGYKFCSPYSPSEGYRYDGLYTVEDFRQARGLGGFMVFKYAFKRVAGQEPFPVTKQANDPAS